MPMPRIVTSAAAAVALVVLLGLLFGPRGAAGGAVVGFLGIVWRHDDQSGACLPLAVLLLLVVGVMLLLMFLLIVMHPR